MRAGLFECPRTTATPRALGCLLLLFAFALVAVELLAQHMRVIAVLPLRVQGERDIQKSSLDMLLEKSPDSLSGSGSTYPPSSSKNSRLECLSRLEDLSVFQRKQYLPQVFIFMAAKAGGSLLKEFAMDCSGPGYRNHHPDNFMNSEEPHFKPFLLNSLQPPKIVTSHIFSDKPLIDLIQHGSNKRTVILYVYRDETDRLQSAIRQVVKSRLCVPGASKYTFKKYFRNVSKSVFGIDESKLDQSCTFNEEPLIEHLIRPGMGEVGFNVPSTLTCNLWSEIDESAPSNILFVHFSQVDQLQRTISNMYCPHVEPKRKSINANKREEKHYWVRTIDETLVGFENWIQAKADTIEFALKLSSGGCKNKARSIQDKLEHIEQCHFVRIRPKEWD